MTSKTQSAIEGRSEVVSEELHKNRFEKWKTLRVLAVRRELTDKLLSDNKVVAKLEDAETWGEALGVLVEEILNQIRESPKVSQAKET